MILETAQEAGNAETPQEKNFLHTSALSSLSQMGVMRHCSASISQTGVDGGRDDELGPQGYKPDDRLGYDDVTSWVRRGTT